MIKVGQGVLGIIPFKDGIIPQYPRTYIVVLVLNDKIGVLNVSSTFGKEHKLLLNTNLRLIKYKPPFLKDSFVKLDSLVYISIDCISDLKTLHNGEVLNDKDLNNILLHLELYNILSPV